MIYIIMLVIFLITMLASYRVKSYFREYSKFPTRYTGHDAARLILDKSGLRAVKIEKTSGFLTDHYDASQNVLRLSSAVYSKASLASVGIAAHEAGHAIQKAKNYHFLTLRQTLVPIARFSSWAFNILIIVGIFGSIFLNMFGLIKIAIVFLGITVFVSLITLPVEFDASKRAKQLLLTHGIVTIKENAHIARILNAAALTYVISAASAVITLLYMVFGLRSGD